MAIIKITTKSELIVKVDDEAIDHFEDISEMVKSINPALQNGVVSFERLPDDTEPEQDWTNDSP